MQVLMATSPAAPGQPNEDFAGATPHGAVLLDGAGQADPTSPCFHGVAWHTRHLGAALLAGLSGDDGRDLRAILSDAITETAGAHGERCELDHPATPAATVVMLRITGDDLEYLVLADSVLVLERPHDAPLVVTDNREGQIGRPYRTEMDEAPNGTPEHEEARRHYIHALRPYRNRPGGFWVAAADPHAAAEAILGRCPREDLSAVALFSDGASRLADRFGLAGWSDLLAILHDHGPAELILRVRAAEATDPRGARWPRSKTHDDATAVYCTRLRDA